MDFYYKEIFDFRTVNSRNVMHIEKNSTNPHITDTIVVSDFRNVNVAGSDLIGLMNQKKNHTIIFLTQCSQLLPYNQMRKN